MPRHCAYGCPYKPGVSIHHFPNPDKFPERFETWVKLSGVKLEDIGDYTLYYRTKRVCDIHFQDKDRNRYKRLNALSVPSLHLPVPAVPSHSIKGDSEEDDNVFETEIREQNKLIEKLIEETNKDETEIREQNKVIEKFMEQTNKDESEIRENNEMPETLIKETNKVQKSADDKKYGSKRYLSMLIPVAKKSAIIAPGSPSERQQCAKFLERYENSPKQPKIQLRLSENCGKILQQDNAVHKKYISELLVNQDKLEFRIKELETKNKHDEVYKKRISELLVNQNKLELRIKELETKIKHDEDVFITQVKETFSNVFTSNQVDKIMGKKEIVRWNEIEYTKAYTLYDLNKNAYFYTLHTLNYPFPDFTSLQKWAAKFGDEMLDSDDDEILDSDDDEKKQPLLKRIKLTLDKTTKQYHNKKKDYTDCAIEENELPSDAETIDDNFISNTLKTGNDYSNIEKYIDRTKHCDRLDNIEVTESTSFANVNNNNDNEMYKEVDYLNHDIEDENDDYTHNNVVENVTDKSSDDDNNLNNDLDDYYDKIDEQMTEIFEQSDEYYNEVIIDNIDEHEVIENLNRDNSSDIEEDNG